MFQAESEKGKKVGQEPEKQMGCRAKLNLNHSNGTTEYASKGFRRVITA
jgi:hypothetical protein